MKRWILLLGLLGLPYSTRAAELGPYAGLGFVLQNMLKVTNSAKATRSLLGEGYFPELVAGYRIWNLFPSFGWTILGKKIHDGEKRRYLMRLDLPYVFPLAENTEIKAGAGLLFHRIRGGGKNVSIRNGSSVSTFFVPAGNRSSANLYLAGGLGLQLKGYNNIFLDSVRVDFDLLVGGPFTRRRSVNFAARGGYVF